MSEKSSPKAPPDKTPASGAAPPRTPSNPGFFNPRMAAARTAAPPQSFSDRAKSFVADLGLNTLSVLRELADDFKRSDRFFKYKVLVIVSWLALSVAGIVVAMPSNGPRNDLDAKLTMTTVVGDTVFSLKNEGQDPWTEVTVIANGSYMLAAPRVEANEMLTFEAKRLTGANGKPAPKDLRAVTLVLKTAEGRSELIKDGQAVE